MMWLDRRSLPHRLSQTPLQYQHDGNRNHSHLSSARQHSLATTMLTQTLSL